MKFNELTEEQKEKALEYLCNYINYWKCQLELSRFRYSIERNKEFLIKEAKKYDWILGKNIVYFDR